MMLSSVALYKIESSRINAPGTKCDVGLARDLVVATLVFQGLILTVLVIDAIFYGASTRNAGRDGTKSRA